MHETYNPKCPDCDHLIHFCICGHTQDTHDRRAVEPQEEEKEPDHCRAGEREETDV